LGHAAIASLIVATAVAVAALIGLSVLGQPLFYRYPDSAYPVAVRIGIGLVLATFPAALAAIRANRAHLARWLAMLGATGSVGFASWLAIHALRTEAERHSLEPSNLVGLVTLLCVPALLLIGARSTNGRLGLGRGGVLAGLLATLFVTLTATDLLQRGRIAVLGPEGTSTGPAPSLHETGLTEGIAVTLVVSAAWHVIRRRQARDLAVAWALMLPALGYAVGTFITPIFFRPGIVSRIAGLGPHLLEVAFVAAAVVLLGVLAVASMRRPQNVGRPPERRSRWPARGSRWST
jgi:hypothetical protein